MELFVTWFPHSLGLAMLCFGACFAGLVHGWLVLEHRAIRRRARRDFLRGVRS